MPMDLEYIAPYPDFLAFGFVILITRKIAAFKLVWKNLQKMIFF